MCHPYNDDDERYSKRDKNVRKSSMKRDYRNQEKEELRNQRKERRRNKESFLY